MSNLRRITVAAVLGYSVLSIMIGWMGGSMAPGITLIEAGFGAIALALLISFGCKKDQRLIVSVVTFLASMGGFLIASVTRPFMTM